MPKKFYALWCVGLPVFLFVVNQWFVVARQGGNGRGGGKVAAGDLMIESGGRV
ncbi:hypothetical protein ACK31R_09950 [Aeromonas caviae]